MLEPIPEVESEDEIQVSSEIGPEANCNIGIRPFRDLQPIRPLETAVIPKGVKVELTEQVIREKVKKCFKTRVPIGTKNQNKARTRKERQVKDNIHGSMF